jgi:hypothetical protein
MLLYYRFKVRRLLCQDTFPTIAAKASPELHTRGVSIQQQKLWKGVSLEARRLFSANKLPQLYSNLLNQDVRHFHSGLTK